MKYFLHRIQASGNTIQDGVEVYDTLDSAVLSYWGRMKTGYGRSEYNFVHCFITDETGAVDERYNSAWSDKSEMVPKFFLSHIRKDGETFNKDIDVLDNLDSAYGNLAVQMEYGHNNPKFPNVSFVHCLITDNHSGKTILHNRAWVKPVEPTPEPEA